MKKAIICDIDGTLAIRGDRGPFEHEKAQEDKVNTHVSNLLSIAVPAPISVSILGLFPSK